ncbi:MAG TPA: glycosyltransferase family 4 protein [Bryobacteraceae bacterium]|jgi:hypothetical protein|nr:glycosyltransferase family 4 protein [Bryobacteraceae bacterium]
MFIPFLSARPTGATATLILSSKKSSGALATSNRKASGQFADRICERSSHGQAGISCVRFTGPINPARIREHYERADIFALASFTEGLPIALMEAMAMQIPCVASCITGIPELIRDGVTGLLFSPGNIDDLTRALRILIGDTALRQRIGEAARLHVIQHYNLHVNVARLAEVFGRELLPVNASEPSELISVVSRQ